MRMKLSCRGGHLKRNKSILNCGRPVTQLMRDSLGSAEMPERRKRRLKPSVQVEIAVGPPSHPPRKLQWLSRIVSSAFTHWSRWRSSLRRTRNTGN